MRLCFFNHLTCAGIKLKKEVQGTENYTLHYIGGIEYREEATIKIESIHHAEGRVTYDENDEAVYEYHLKDHLGNVRIAFADKDGDGYIEPFSVNPSEPNSGTTDAAWNLTDTEILQESHYYPFGMAMDGAWQDIMNDPQNNYLYNGKELQTDFGLDWSDYGARYYDAAIGRWNAVDPLAEKYQWVNPYNYVINNPITYIDPDGKSIDVSELLGSKEGLWTLFNMIGDLQQITGMSLKVNGDHQLVENKKGTNESYGSSKAREHLRGVIDDPESIEVHSLGDKPNMVFGENKINLNVNDTEGKIKAMGDAGIESLTWGFGMTFLHETLHTKVGAKVQGKSTSYFSHDIDDTSERVGNNISLINEFRNQLGLATRETYDYWPRGFDVLRGKYSVLFNKNGEDVKVYGGKEWDSTRKSGYENPAITRLIPMD